VLLVDDTQPFATGRKNPHGRRGRENRRNQVRRGIEDVLAIVEHQQPDPALQRGGHRLAHALARLLGNAQHRGHGGQLENPYAVWELTCQLRSGLKCETRFTHAAHTGQRDQPMRAQRRLDVRDVGVATDQGGGRGPQVARTGVEGP
jgi:hypothetical protein